MIQLLPCIGALLVSRDDVIMMVDPLDFSKPDASEEMYPAWPVQRLDW